MKTNNLKKALKTLFQSSITQVFYNQASSTATFPYLVYEFRSVNNEISTDYIVEADVWDKGMETVNIDNICDELEELHQYVYTDNNIQFRLYFESRQSIIDENKELKRRRLVFTLKLYEIEEE